MQVIRIILVPLRGKERGLREESHTRKHKKHRKENSFHPLFIMIAAKIKKNTERIVPFPNDYLSPPSQLQN
jgi:hypothetical protein